METIFQEACLLRLSISTWNGVKKLEPSIMERLGEPDWLKGRKVLVDPTYLSSIKATAQKARCLIKKRALPFPMPGLNLVPKESIVTIENQLEDIKHEFNANVRLFLRNYTQARYEAQQSLGNLFDPLDYPLDPSQKFNFNWIYVQLNMPGEHSILSPQLYEREREKFVNLMEQTREEAISALRGEFSGLIDHLVDRLGTKHDKPKVLRSSVLTKLNEFLDNFRSRNLFMDQELESLVQETRSIINGIDTEMLRDNHHLRDNIRQNMEQVKTEIDAAVTDMPRRKIQMEAA